jgi:tetratricopeptide (TPR) repeat protein
LNNVLNKTGGATTVGPGAYRLTAVLLALLSFIVFIPALSGEFLGWDDNVIITGNPLIRSFDWRYVKACFTVPALGNWIPLSMLSLGLDCAVWGMNPWGFHLTSNVLHALNALFVFVLVTALVEAYHGFDDEARKLGQAVVAGAVTALLFAVHPLRVESVAWITERKDMLFSAFYLLSVIFYLRYARKESLRAYHYAAAVCFAALSLMSKPMAVSLPITLAVIDLFVLKRHGRGAGELARVAIEKLPFFALALFTVYINIAFNRAAGIFKTATAASPASYDYYHKTLILIRGFFFYVEKTLLPTGLAPMHPGWLKVGPLEPEFAASILLFVAVTVFSILTLRKRGYIAAAWAYYVLSLLPILPVAAMMDRFTYLAHLGPLVLIGLAASWGFERRKTAVVATVIATTLVLSIMAARQSAVWRDTITLWTHELKIYPRVGPLSYYNRGVAYGERGMLVEAVADYSRAIEADPTRDEFYYNRGNALRELGRTDEALSDYTKAAELEPRGFKAQNNRANLLKDKGLLKEAMEAYSLAIKANPRFVPAYFNRGKTLAERGMLKEAIRDFATIIKIEPTNKEAYFALGMIYAKIGDRKTSDAALIKAASLGHDGARKMITQRR